MTALDKNPASLNTLDPSGFRFQIKKLPNVNFHLQELVVPEVTLPDISVPTPFVNNKIAGDHIVYAPLNIEFEVDENLANYCELYNWFKGLGFPQTLNQYQELAAKPRITGEGIFSDASVMVTTNLKNPNIEFVFQDCFPTFIGNIKFLSTAPSRVHPTCSATFSYTLFEVHAL
jgi:hypothetical protein